MFTFTIRDQNQNFAPACRHSVMATFGSRLGAWCKSPDQTAHHTPECTCPLSLHFSQNPFSVAPLTPVWGGTAIWSNQCTLRCEWLIILNPCSLTGFMTWKKGNLPQQTAKNLEFLVLDLNSLSLATYSYFLLRQLPLPISIFLLCFILFSFEKQEW